MTTTNSIRSFVVMAAVFLFATSACAATPSFQSFQFPPGDETTVIEEAYSIQELYQNRFDLSGQTIVVYGRVTALDRDRSRIILSGVTFEDVGVVDGRLAAHCDPLFEAYFSLSGEMDDVFWLGQFDRIVAIRGEFQHRAVDFPDDGRQAGTIPGNVEYYESIDGPILNAELVGQYDITCHFG